MDRKKLLLLIAALVIAIAAAVGVNMLLRGNAATQVQAVGAPEIKGPQILVATRALDVGTILTPDMVRYQPWPTELVQAAYFKQGEADLSSLTGAVVRTAITAGQPLTTGAVVHPGDHGFLAAALAPGMRAVAIRVQDDTSVAGLVFPGDRVDLLVTQEQGNSDSGQFRAAETFLHNLRVLATDQRLSAKDANGKDEVKTFAVVTLEVTPKMAEQIAVAQKIGQVTLSLRALADSQTELEQAIAAGDVTLPKGVDAKKEQALLAQISGRPTDRGATVTTGAQVSRFQRGGPPPKNISSAPAAPTVVAAPIATPGGSDGPRPQGGPVVRINRGGVVTETPVGSY